MTDLKNRYKPTPSDAKLLISTTFAVRNRHVQSPISRRIGAIRSRIDWLQLDANPDKSTPTPTGQCNAAAVQDLIGKQANPEMLDQARRESRASIARILRPEDIVSLEYNDQRLTLSTDDALVIKRLNCG